ncbi:MAG: EpsI family protein [bacterium]|nr:EpsI family protein [bacterium]
MKLPLRNLILLFVMLAAAGMAIALKPALPTSEQLQTIDLKRIIPQTFSTWSTLSRSEVTLINPQQQELLDSIYSQTLDRSYLDSKSGQVVMLSIAYGGIQSKQSQVHRPEVCYPAQGFQVSQSDKSQIDTAIGVVPVRRLLAVQARRSEPITYWIRVGDSLAEGWIGQKIAVVKQGISGKFADGLLFRTSTIGADSNLSYEVQDRFIRDLLLALKPEDVPFLVGGLGKR